MIPLLAPLKASLVRALLLPALAGAMVAFTTHTASATQITCSGLGPVSVLQSPLSSSITYDSDQGTLFNSVTPDAASPTQLHLLPAAAPNTLDLVDGANTTVATFEVLGHALRPTISWLAPTGRVSCAVTGDPELFFEKLITDKKTLSAIAGWKSWAAARPAPCDPSFDSIGYFQQGTGDHIALVVHGFSSNPRRMEAVIRVLLDAGYNVIAPRLTDHFNKAIRDLDKASASDWEKDVETNFRLATKFSSSVTLVGYSLGGALVSRLALEYPDYVDKMVLIAPAWRVTQGVNFASLIGEAFSISYNDYMKIPIACTVNDGYISAAAGREVQQVGFHLDLKFAGQIEPLPMEYVRIRVPYLVFTTPDDNTILSSIVDPICRTNFLYCTHVEIPDRKHTNFELDMSVKADGDFAKRTMNDILTAFVALPPAQPGYPATLDPAQVPTK